MAIAIGNNQFTTVGQIKIGSNNVQRVYRGNDLIFPIGINFGTGFNLIVYSIKLQSDGKVLVGGTFSTYQGVTYNRIIRLNSDGSIDTSFNIGTGFNGGVNIISIQSDGKVLVGGTFSTYQGVTYNRIIRLNIDGSVDTSFNVGTGFNGGVNIISIQSDGKILAGGNFTSYNGTTYNRIIRLNIDGSVDSSFNIGTGFNNWARSIVIQSDNKILVGGDFSIYNGTTSNRIIRLNSDGSIDTSFNIGNGFNGDVDIIYIQSDGKVLVGGTFSTYQGVTYNRIIRLNSNGSIDTSFNVGTGFTGQSVSIKLQSDGKVLVGGNFSTYQGVTYNRIIRLNSDGSIDTSFNIGTGFNVYILSIQLQSDDRILLGGDFTSYQGITANRIIQLNTDGSRSST
jgi:uncharacterized delta-60 repeat protein